MENMAHYGVPVMVLINKFASDTDQELSKLKELVQMMALTAKLFLP